MPQYSAVGDQEVQRNELRPPSGGAGIHRIRAGLLVLNLLAISAVALLLWRLWDVELRGAEIRAEATVTQLQQTASATLGEVEVAVRYAAAQAEAQLGGQTPPSESFWTMMDAARMNLAGLERMGIFDKSGRRLCSPQDSACRRYDIGDRDYFLALRKQQPDQRPSVHGPILARPSNELALLVVQAIRTPDKAFAGAIVAVVPVSRLQPLVAAARVGAKGLSGLRTQDLQLLTRAADASGDSASSADGVSDILRQRVAGSPEAGTYRAVVGPDALDRIVAYRKLPFHPLYALVGLAVEDATDGWNSAARWAAGLVLSLVAASVAIERLARSGLKRQAQVQALYDGAPCGYHSLDALGRYVDINATELNWLGCSREDVVGKLRPADFFTDEGRAAFEASYPVFQREGHLDQRQFDLVGRQGETRRVIVTATAVADAHGHFLQSRSVMHDITALHAAQAELAARADEQQAMLENELVGMVKVRAGLITWTNREMERIFGYTQNEWIGLPIATLFDDEAYYRQTAARIGALAYRSGMFREDQGLRRKDGSRVWVDVSTVKIDPTGGESFTIVKDITDRKLAEAQRLRSVELEAQNLGLSEAGRLKDEFLANMSHELRTPLNAVIGLTRLLGMNKAVAEVPKLASHVRLIGESGQYLLELIRTMLDYAKNASRKLQFTPSPLRVSVALREAADMLEPKRVAAGVDLTVSVEPGLDIVINDPLRLRQMLLSLLANAIKFSRPGGAVLMDARALGDDRWRLEVTDQGIGIAAEDLPRLFTPFMQLSAGRTKAYSGTGLGLALVRSIAQAQGGDVQVRSELGQGTVFTLTLPRSLRGTDPRGR